MVSMATIAMPVCYFKACI